MRRMLLKRVPLDVLCEIVCIIVIIFLTWFTSRYLIEGWSTKILISTDMFEWRSLKEPPFHPWVTMINTGSLRPLLPRSWIAHIVLDALARYVGRGNFLKAIIVISILMSGIGMYSYMRMFTSRIPALIAAILYAFSPQLVCRLWVGQVYIIVNSAFLPILLASLRIAFTKDLIIGSLALGLLLFIATSWQIHYVVIIPLILLIYSITYLAIGGNGILTRLRRVLICGMLSLAVATLLHMPCLILLMSIREVIEVSLLPKEITWGAGLFKGFIGNAPYLPFSYMVSTISVHVWAIMYALLLVMAFLGAARRKEYDVLSAAIVLALGVALSTRILGPFIVEHIPMGTAFREYTKFAQLVILGFSTLVAAGVDAFMKGREDIIMFFIRGRVFAIRSIGQIRIAIVLLTIIASLLYCPTAVLEGLHANRFLCEVPEEYLELEKIIEGEWWRFRALWLPEGVNFYPTLSWAKVPFSPGISRPFTPIPIICPTYRVQYVHTPLVLDPIANLYYCLAEYMKVDPSYIVPLLKVLNIKYIVLCKDVDNFRAYEEPLKRSGFQLLREGEHLTVYELPYNASRIYLVNSTVAILGNYLSIPALNRILGLEPLSRALVFLNENVELERLDRYKVEALVLYERDLLDFIPLYCNGVMISLHTQNMSRGWTITDLEAYYRVAVTGEAVKEFLISTRDENATVEMNIYVEEEGEYLIMLKALRDADAGVLRLSVDDIMMMDVMLNSTFRAFDWILCGLQNIHGFKVLSKLFVAKENDVKRFISNITSGLMNKVPTLIIFEAEHTPLITRGKLHMIKNASGYVVAFPEFYQPVLSLELFKGLRLPANITAYFRVYKMTDKRIPRIVLRGDRLVKLDYLPPGKGWLWIKVEPGYRMRILGHQIAVDAIVLSQFDMNSTLSLMKETEVVIPSYQAFDPGHYRVIGRYEYKMVVFLERYDSLWNIDDQLDHVEAYGYANLFTVGNTVDNDIKLRLPPAYQISEQMRIYLMWIIAGAIVLLSILRLRIVRASRIKRFLRWLIYAFRR